MDIELVILHFASPEAAQGAHATIRSLEAEGFIDIDDAALLTRADDGTVTAEPLHHDEVVRKGSVGGLLGAVAGGLVGLPIIGIVAGAAIGASRSKQVDELDELISTTGEKMAPGSAVLALAVTAILDVEVVVDRLAIHQDDLLSTQIPEDLRRQLDEER